MSNMSAKKPNAVLEWFRSMNNPHSLLPTKKNLQDASLGQQLLKSHLSEGRQIEKSSESELNPDQVPLRYGFECLAKLLSILGLYGHAAILNAQPGLYIPGAFAGLVYFICVFGVIWGIIVMRAIYMTDNYLKSIELNLGGLNFVRAVTELSKLFYMLFGPFSVMYVFYYRNFLQDFIIYNCSNLTLPAYVQRRTIINLLACSLFYSLVAEPISFALTIYIEFNQPQYLPQLSSFSFKSLRMAGSLIIGFLMSMLSFIEFFIPILICFLSCSIKQQLVMTFEKQQKRFLGMLESTRIDDKQFGRIFDEFSLRTICTDWPEICDSQTVDSGEQSVEKKARRTSKSGFVTGGQLLLIGSLLQQFLQLRATIKCFEKRYSGFHLFWVSLHGFIVAQYIVVGSIKQTNAHSTTHTLLTDLKFWRVCFSVTMYVISNIFTFLYFNQLPDRIIKLRCQLFKIILDLGNNLAQHSDSLESNDLELWREELVDSWLLYDRVIGVTEQLNFKFSANTYYSKKCLLILFGREVSLVLLYMQVLDLYELT